MGKALIIVAVVAVLAYMFFFNDMRYHAHFDGHREDTLMKQAGTGDDQAKPAPATDGSNQ